MRVIFFIFFCIFSFSSSKCADFKFSQNKWKQVDRAGEPIKNPENNQQIEITTENLYSYLRTVNMEN